ncbi:Histone deacetylase 8 [Entomophthora muscae]|uniref:Histone deacetylase 8 n=1 Tax=Entomophthora muscae TaxID=34485 RepID=A0ACC2UHI3_9FUNG|nr:Histone deacetylase 8 [Entomophthora muscae]
MEAEADVVINWDGGRHHGKHGAASGFCYVNDIVISIIQMSQEFDKIMYIDLDLHHGDGVEEAFYHTSKVLTVSLHRYDAGFFPGTGARVNQGKGRGLYHALNVPLKPGLSDQVLKKLFDKIIYPAYGAYKPEALVLQCGADGLAGDRHREWNLSISGFSYCISQILSWDLPTLILGGGGYNHPNTARCYAQLTSIVLDSPLMDFTSEAPLVNIPEHDYFCEYLPDYTLQLAPGSQKDENTEEYLCDVIDSVKIQIQAIVDT